MKVSLSKVERAGLFGNSDSSQGSKDSDFCTGQPTDPGCWDRYQGNMTIQNGTIVSDSPYEQQAGSYEETERRGN